MKKPICVILIIINTLLGFGIWDSGFAEEYLLGPNDTLEINIIGHKDMETKQTVTPDGQVSLPILGVIPIQGKTLKGLQKYLTDSYSAYIEKPQITINLTPKPIYVVQYDLKKDTWEVKKAASVDEANAYAGLVPSEAEGINSKFTLENGSIYKVSMGTKPDFWESNWYKVITAAAVMVGIYATMHK